MPRGSTRMGRARASLVVASSESRPLLRGLDHGEAVPLRAADLGAAGDRWVQPFLAANARSLERLELRAEVSADRSLGVVLFPGARVGAVPLLSPSTRRVVAGILIQPRFRWPALGSVLNTIGFSVEPALGGAPLVPGSAREVPPWVLAGPVIQRISAFLTHRRRGFVERHERRISPRGRVDWTDWGVSYVARGEWTKFPCRFSDPDTDPTLLAAVRWTLGHLKDRLGDIQDSLTARQLIIRASELLRDIGPGPERRPPAFWPVAEESEWIASAVQAMTWVSEERGLGGEQSLDGLAWDLSIDAVWESWVWAFAADLGRCLGLVASPFQSARKRLRWEGPVQSMTALAPDVELKGADRVVLFDAKYKRHLDVLTRKSWQASGEELRHDHRADLHQALAYASLSDAPRVDTVLVYPTTEARPFRPATLARVASGRRLVRLILASIPFGYKNRDQQEAYLQSFRSLLAA